MFSLFLHRTNMTTQRLLWANVSSVRCQVLQRRSTLLLRHLSSKKRSPSVYSSTVLLPRSTFPARVEGQTRIEKDEELVQSSNVSELYSWQMRNLAYEKRFVLHDGPPYANGKLHLGHALNKILKDITNRWKLVQGQGVHFRPGWDCHGLPIELQAQKQTQSLKSPLEIRSEARKFALDTMEKQREQFVSWAIMGDWKRPYLTLDPNFTKKQLWLFKKMYDRGMIFRRFMPVYWSPWTRTALAESELEYNASHTSPSAYVKFELTSASKARLAETNFDDISLLIWTTTPWTLISNRAVCVKKEADYCLVRNADKGCFIVAKTSLEKNGDLETILSPSIEIISEFQGDQLLNLQYKRVLCEEQVAPVLHGDHVTLDTGTGLVHTAPAHGKEDHMVGVDHNLELQCFVDDKGCFENTENIHPKLRGLHVLDEGNSKTLELLKAKDSLVHLSEYKHSYPYDWRSKKPVILRASKQWFLDTERLKQDALETIQKVEFKPPQLKASLERVISRRPYWCISRQRCWGAPIPVIYNCEEESDFIIDSELIQQCAKLMDELGPDFWWLSDTKTLLGNRSLDTTKFKKGDDILDVWFDSGVSWQTLEDYRADLYLEGIDQFSGWFYTSLLTYLASGKSEAPYKSVFVHGFALDERGHKMSKSLDNVVSPEYVSRGENKATKVYGVDVLRYWAAAQASAGEPVLVGAASLDTTRDEVNRVRGVFKFILGNLETSSPIYENKETKLTSMLDKFVVHQLSSLYFETSSLYDSMEYDAVCRRIQHFLANDLSALYFNLVKDRLYCEQKESEGRHSALITLNRILLVLHKLLAPIMPLLAEEVRQHRITLGDAFMTPWQFDVQSWQDESVKKSVSTLIDLQKLITAKMQENKLRHVTLTIDCKDKYLSQFLDTLSQYELCEVLNVSRVITTGEKDSCGSDYSEERFEFETYEARLAMTAIEKAYICQRCRKFHVVDEGELCVRCTHVLSTSSK